MNEINYEDIYPLPPRNTYINDEDMRNFQNEISAMIDKINEIYNHHTCAFCGKVSTELHGHVWSYDKHIYFGLVCERCKENAKLYF